MRKGCGEMSGEGYKYSPPDLASGNLKVPHRMFRCIHIRCSGVNSIVETSQPNCIFHIVPVFFISDVPILVDHKKHQSTGKKRPSTSMFRDSSDVPMFTHWIFRSCSHTENIEDQNRKHPSRPDVSTHTKWSDLDIRCSGVAIFSQNTRVQNQNHPSR